MQHSSEGRPLNSWRVKENNSLIWDIKEKGRIKAYNLLKIILDTYNVMLMWRVSRLLLVIILVVATILEVYPVWRLLEVSISWMGLVLPTHLHPE